MGKVSKNIKTRDVETVSMAPPKALLLEIAWEVCQQLGGIYTVIRSKAPSMVERWGNQYCLVGPYSSEPAAVELEQTYPTEPFAQVIDTLKSSGYGVYFGTWLVTGRPQVILLDPHSAMHKLSEIKYYYWEHHGIGIPVNDDEMNQVMTFGFLVQELLRLLTKHSKIPVIAHFHEWMSAAAIPEIRYEKLPVGMVFTTHATLLGRYNARGDPWFYDHLPFVNWQNDARRYNVESRVLIERAAADGAHVFTTVSDITALECKHLIGRTVDMVLPNGLNIERFIARHETENMHKVYKEQIHHFVMGHFFPNYSFDLDHTLYFFTSGRYEYRNKGFDLTLESMARLNQRMKTAGSNLTVVMFIITRRACRSINADVLNNHAMLEELHHTCEAIKNQMGERLFKAAAMGTLPTNLKDFVNEYWWLRLRRTMHAWRTDRLPYIITHDILDNDQDEVLNQLRALNLVNAPEDPVKIVYHPDFISTSDPLFGMDYDQFVRGCHLGIFPSYYEPWGYTPLECLARGIPAVTSDLSGFGSYIMKNSPDCQDNGLYVLRRKDCSFDNSTEELIDFLLEFVKLGLRERIDLRLRSQRLAEQFDWNDYLRCHYDRAHALALKLLGT